MVKRRGGNFNLSGRRCLAIFRQHPAQKFDLLFAKLQLVLLGKIHSLARERRYHLVIRQIFFIHPGELGKHLKVAPVAFSESLRGALAALSAHPSMKLDIARPARQQIVIIHLERAQQELGFVFRRKIRYRAKRSCK